MARSFHRFDKKLSKNVTSQLELKTQIYETNEVLGVVVNIAEIVNQAAKLDEQNMADLPPETHRLAIIDPSISDPVGD
ncbi:hypothetical protein L484_012023 [Morus notabilis]|uniref:Uncharacterized protein n=1 Tax=Morus notabilis TaxID=981085 RepID=W9QZN2_9ROSA|nr:hypothetical protein L484_012023 [Morus notabilis]